jgi:hypothetical protein
MRRSAAASPLAVRYLPHLESTVVLYDHESSLTEERAGIGSR